MSDHDNEMPARRRCPVCGETNPYPAWFCLPRAIGEAEKGKPCSYSVEGNARMGKQSQKVS